MRRETIRLLAMAVMVLCLVLTVGYGWRLSTIIADTTSPRFIEVTEGSVPYPADGRLRVRAVVEENVGMKTVTCELYSWGRRLEKITLSLNHKLSGSRYLYVGFFGEGEGGSSTGGGTTDGGSTTTGEETGGTTGSGGGPGGGLETEPFELVWLAPGARLTLVYWATDEAGNKAKYTAQVTLLADIDIDGYVTVNGKRVEGPDDVVYVRSLSLDIRVYVTQGLSFVDIVSGRIDGSSLSFAKKTGYAGHPYWQAAYTLPGDGRYSFTVRVKATTGEEFLFASFIISIGFRELPRDRLLLALGAVAVLGVAAVYGYHSRRGGGGAGSGRRS
jgi:hypothetical protein